MNCVCQHFAGTREGRLETVAHAGRCSPAGKAAARARACVRARAPTEVGDTENIAPWGWAAGRPKYSRMWPLSLQEPPPPVGFIPLSRTPEGAAPRPGARGGRRRPRAGRREACRELWSPLSPRLWDVWRRSAGSSFPALLVGPGSPTSPPPPSPAAERPLPHPSGFSAATAEDSEPSR